MPAFQIYAMVRANSAPKARQRKRLTGGALRDPKRWNRPLSRFCMRSSYRRWNTNRFGFIALLYLAIGTLAHGEGLSRSKVELCGGIPTFTIDGVPHPGTCYSTYDCRPAELGRRVKQFAGTECDVFNFVVEVSGYGYSRPMWSGKDQWDFAELDERVRVILAAAPKARLVPRIYLDAPEWWRRENPTEMMVLGNGSTSFGEKLFALPRPGEFPSLASEKWRGDMRRALARVIEHVDRSDYAGRVIGYQLSGQKTEEWYHWSMNTDRLGDYSPHVQSEFRRWLRSRYRTDECLQKAWGRPGMTIETAPIPSQQERFGDRTRTFRDPVRERRVIDFHTFWSDVMADTIALFARTVKEATGGRKVVGAFYGYTFEFTELAEDAGHLALGRLTCSPDVDFIMAPSSYFNRNLPGSPYFRFPVASLRLHGKVAWNDFDQVSYKYFDKLREDPGLKQWEYQMGLTKTAEEFVWMNRREVGMGLTQGVQSANFDIHGGYYEDPVILAGVAQLNRIRTQATRKDQRASAAEILVLVDEESEHYLSFRNPVTTRLLSAQIAALDFVGPYDALLLSDLAMADTRQYKLVLVLNAAKLDEDQRGVLGRKVACGGKTVLWFHAPGYLTSQGSDPANMERLTGLRILPDGFAGADREARPTEGSWGRLNAETSVAFRSAKARENASFAERKAAVLDQPILKLLPGEQFHVVDPGAVVLAQRVDQPDKVVLAPSD